MRQKNKAKRRSPKTVLGLPDLDHSKSSVLQTLGSAASQKTYAFAIDDFIGWYCSEPRLAFGRTVVLRYRYHLEARQLAAATINLRLAAVRRLAYLTRLWCRDREERLLPGFCNLDGEVPCIRRSRFVSAQFSSGFIHRAIKRMTINSRGARVEPDFRRALQPRDRFMEH